MQILTTQAAEKLLRQPGVKVIRNPLPLHWVRLVGAMYFTLLWLGLLVMIIVCALETHDLWRSYWALGIIMLVHVATCVSIFIAGRRTILALNNEGMYRFIFITLCLQYGKDYYLCKTKDNIWKPRRNC